MRVDGVARNGTTNVALWLQRSDLERTNPTHIRETFTGTPGIDVLVRLERLGEIPTNVQDPALELGMKTPTIARALFTNGKDVRSDKNYAPLSPKVLHFYGGEHSPEYAAVMEMIIERQGELPQELLDDALPPFLDGE